MKIYREGMASAMPKTIAGIWALAPEEGILRFTPAMRTRVKTTLKLLLLASLAFVAATLASAQQPPATTPAQTQKSVEAFLRNFYALGSDITITVGTPKPIGS